MLRNQTKALLSASSARNLLKRNSKAVFSGITNLSTLKNNQSLSSFNNNKECMMNFSSSIKARSENQTIAFGESYQRNQYCGEVVGDELVGKQVKLNGWVENIRIINQNECVFVTVRDVSGVVQVMLKKKELIEYLKDNEIKNESVVFVSGVVSKRPSEMMNPNMKTGAYEIEATELLLLNKAKTLPLQLVNAEEEIRLKYRYLDLRRRQLVENLSIRSKALAITRKYFGEMNRFLEIETPTLFKSTPEGAREFLVPTRQKGKFYALTQSPQQYKQLLMVGGMDRYFQIARCYRDESGRMDRQPEFTQIDLEMSFLTQKDIYALIENFIKMLWKDILGIDIKTPFQQMKYRDAMDMYGSDKPDLRYEDLKFKNVTEIFKNEKSQIEIVNQTVADAGFVYALKAKQIGATMTRKIIDQFTEKAKSVEKTRLIISTKIGKPEEPFLNGKLTEQQQAKLREQLDLKEGDMLILSVDKEWETTVKGLGRVREQCAKYMTEQGIYQFNTIEEKYRFLWVIDFQLFERAKDQHGQAHLHTSRGLSAMHHPFTAPHAEDIPLLYSDDVNDILKVRGQHYDCVLNGVELGGGSIRIHQADMQKYVLEKVLELGEERTMVRFGHLIEALSYGAPPHGGLALGFDRLICLLCGEDKAKTLRDVIAFPKSSSGNEIMTQAPGEVEEDQLKELFIKVDNQ
ncbi:tentative aspartyl-tRNA synthetase [Naegleria gruberi]|uniref:Tentative aspartyl-tRNA synthetase n=1 Tax=Naegleria gruberi TaxID=5762 RepID=D2VKV6_NAEGR|nr:tentative aspartyl-tRNA synthetase [Naegleria gruberi]EFC42509.1 tentative aspartyl-tRNA synthetase [Naegleria gruberi]|eukprot:XP_002675253.1 tentative aspartyl-tRNA synthetase [Naegleria gruberi strain NEG-M]